MKTLEYWRFEAAEADTSSLRIDLGVMKDESKVNFINFKSDVT